MLQQVHAMPARTKYLKGLVDALTKTSRAEKLAAYERWADLVEVEDLVVLDTSSLKALRELADHEKPSKPNLTLPSDGLDSTTDRGPRSASCSACRSKPLNASTPSAAEAPDR